ncbi:MULTISPECIES: recombinase family protein [Rhodococcus]|uniref:Recombinase family protein n=2 Tax=Rhodococcus TaxID=1827 RepID=A0ABU4BYY6_RHOGO|nr:MULTISPECIES: recombinase family protein [Rhodococcus]MDV6269446.1 recombinase family protein [Rhodococcus globerulus]MDV8068158.1 recombinase family protein [Rhodococcus sp. IEGM 1366]
MGVSGTDHVLDLQSDALAAIRCDRGWEEAASGAKDDRPVLLDLLSHLRAGDTLVVWRLDRLGRSLKHLGETVEDLQRRGAAFRSLTESTDTSSAGGMLIFQILGALAQFERTLIRARTAQVWRRLALVVVSAGSPSELTQRKLVSFVR